MKQHSIHTEMIKQDELFLEALPGHLLPDQASQGRRSIMPSKGLKWSIVEVRAKTTSL